MRSKRAKILWGILAFVILALIVFRLALPKIVEDYVNQKLDQIPEYDGQIGHVNIHLIRGAYTIHDVNILKRNGAASVPFFSSPKVDLSVQWRELFHRALVGEIHVYRPEVHFVKAKSESESQTSIDKSWLQVVQDLFPFRINRFDIHDGEVWFHDIGTKPKVDIYMTNLFVICTNLYNTRRFATELPADFRAKGATIGEGKFEVQVKLDPLVDEPKFDLELQVRGMNLVALNEFLEAYGKFNVKRGTFEVFSEIAGENGRFDGYVKPFFEDLDVLDLSEDSKNPLKLAWQAIVAGAVQLFKNHSKDQVATKIPVSGTFDKAHVEVWTTIANVLRNAFVQAFNARLDKSINLFQRDEESKKKENPKNEPDSKGERNHERESRHNPHKTSPPAG